MFESVLMRVKFIKETHDSKYNPPDIAPCGPSRFLPLIVSSSLAIEVRLPFLQCDERCKKTTIVRSKMPVIPRGFPQRVIYTLQLRRFQKGRTEGLQRGVHDPLPVFTPFSYTISRGSLRSGGRHGWNFHSYRSRKRPLC